MTGTPNTPRLLRGGLILVDQATDRVRQVISLQYNPDNVTRSLQAQGVGDEPGDRLETQRLKGPPQETISLEAELDATDQLEHPDENPQVAELGLLPALAALELIIYPTAEQLQANDDAARSGMIEIIPAEGPLVLFVWGRQRVVPVRITEFTVTEEAFDSGLNPTRARVRLGMRVLTVLDLGFTGRGGLVYMMYQQNKQNMAKQVGPGSLDRVGLNAVPGG